MQKLAKQMHTLKTLICSFTRLCIYTYYILHLINDIFSLFCNKFFKSRKLKSCNLFTAKIATSMNRTKKNSNNDFYTVSFTKYNNMITYNIMHIEAKAHCLQIQVSGRMII